jgi:hypothetical protein
MAEWTKAIDSKSIRGPQGSSGVQIPLPPPPSSEHHLTITQAFRSERAASAPGLERCESWLNRHAWRACVPQKGTVGSNPTLSATMVTVAVIHRTLSNAGELDEGTQTAPAGLL